MFILLCSIVVKRKHNLFFLLQLFKEWFSNTNLTNSICLQCLFSLSALLLEAHSACDNLGKFAGAPVPRNTAVCKRHRDSDLDLFFISRLAVCHTVSPHIHQHSATKPHRKFISFALRAAPCGLPRGLNHCGHTTRTHIKPSSWRLKSQFSRRHAFN